MKKQLIILLLSINYFTANSQIAVGGGVPDASAVFQLNSTTKGFVPPRMSSTQRQAIVNPIDGLTVFDTSTDSFWFYNNAKWNQLGTSQYGSVYKQPTDIYDQNGASSDRFGSVVSMTTSLSSNNYAIIGVPGDNGGRGNCYRAFLVINNSWFLNQILPSVVLAGDGYGNAVAGERINSGDAFIVGSSLDDSTNVNSGSAYIFSGSGKSFTNKIVAGDNLGKAANAHFGRSVDIACKNTSNNTGKGFAIVGASGAGGGKGAVYIYKFNPNTLQWSLESNLIDPNGVAGDSLGLSVSLYYDVDVDEAWAFAGAPYDDEIGKTNIGSVLVYRKAIGSAAWVNVAKITPDDGLDNDLFGYAIANCFECQKVMVGSPGKSSNIGRSLDLTLSSIVGNTATFTTTIIPNSGNGGGGSGSGFGMGSTISATAKAGCNNISLVLGSVSGLLPGATFYNFGFARLLKYNGASWSTVISEITDPNPKTGYGYGRAVSISPITNLIVIGAPSEKINGNFSQGKVQFVRIDE